MQTDVKVLLTKFMLLEFSKWFSEFKPIESNDLSILKALKLIFFACSITSSKDNSLLKNGFNFVAMPLGHVETDIYDAYKGKQFGGVIDVTGVSNIDLLHTDFGSLSDALKAAAISAILALKAENKKLILESPSNLVELSHKYSSWINNFRKAKNIGQLSWPIPSNEIIDEEKYYFV
ncbi:hypothetical protein [Sphingobacterium sp. Ag1]|uniref:hypothetical protein n=1 Tax=Sphingobacterium sp. Ag1 TaxID=1643451 RepID=UPI00069C8E69|nr:hypothetical protein [Sphingobacterium sp. Ag1]